MTDPHALEFLHESNLIEGIDNINYADPAHAHLGSGHVGALTLALQKAESREPLTVADISSWQGMITAEQTKFGHKMAEHGIGKIRSFENPHNVIVAGRIAPVFSEVPALMDELVGDLNARSKGVNEFDYVGFVELLGDMLQRFEAIHPFVDGNGRTGRLLVAYIARYFGAPLPIFRASRREDFFSAHRSKLAMRCFLAELVREAIFHHGELLYRQEEFQNADRYLGANGLDLTVEWHELVEAASGWLAASQRTKG